MAKQMALIDWRAMKYYHVRGPLLPLFMLVVGLLSSSLMVMPLGVLMFLAFSVNPFAMEEKGALDNLYLTLPVKRRAIVSGRFLLAIIMGLCGVAIAIPIMALANRIGLGRTYSSLPFSGYVFILALSYLMFAVFLLAMYPVLFKLGYVKGKFWGFILPTIGIGVLYGVFIAISSMPGNEMLPYNILNYAQENVLRLSGGICVLATLLLAVAYMASVRIYEKRDF